MRILLVAPGPKYSTFDIFNYYLDAMKDNTTVEVQPFNYHNVAVWQKLSVAYYKPELNDEEATAIGMSRAARDLLTDVITFQPDVVFVVSGTLLPPDVWVYLVNLRNKLKERFAIALYFTESPYMDKLQLNYLQYADIVFVNDKKSLRTFDQDGTHFVEYLPHSYNPKIHNTENKGNADYESDVFFAGTPFYERGLILAKVDWNEINLLLGGNWVEFCKPEDYLRLRPYIFHDSVIDNDYMAKYYANTKIALNIHRTDEDITGIGNKTDNHKDAYSIGPRVYEAIACGAFMLTDYRQEAIDIFGDSIGYFDTAKELENQVYYWLSHDEERKTKILEAQSKIEKCTFSDRLENIILPIFDEVLSMR